MALGGTLPSFLAGNVEPALLQVSSSPHHLDQSPICRNSQVLLQDVSIVVSGQVVAWQRKGSD